MLGWGSVEVTKLNRVCAQNDDLVLTDRDGTLGVLNESSNVAAQKVFAIAKADNQRSVAAGCQNYIWLVFVNYKNRESAVQTIDHGAKRLDQVTIALVLNGNQVCGYF